MGDKLTLKAQFRKQERGKLVGNFSHLGIYHTPSW